MNKCARYGGSNLFWTFAEERLKLISVYDFQLYENLLLSQKSILETERLKREDLMLTHSLEELSQLHEEILTDIISRHNEV